MIEIRSFRDIVRLFYIFQREFKWAFIATVVVAVLGAFLLPSRYQSDARLLVKPGRDTATIPIELTDRQTLVAPSTVRDPIVDEEKMLTGRPIVNQVAEYYLSVAGQQRPEGIWKTIKFYAKKGVGEVMEWARLAMVLLGVVEDQSPVERLANKLEKQFSVSHASGSAVMEISFAWDDPAIAQQVVRKWVSVYIDERSKALGRQSLYDFYQGESNKLAEQIHGYKTQIGTLLHQIDSVSTRERLDTLTEQINRLEQARANDRAELAGAKGAMSPSIAARKNMPSEVTREREISLNPTQQDLKLKLSALQLERLNLLKNYQPDSAPVREVEASMSEMQRLIAAQSDAIQRSENREPNPLAIMLDRGGLERKVQSGSLQARMESYDKDIAGLRKERSRILVLEPELSRLERDLSVAEKSYLLYRDSLEKARIDQALDSSRISNIAVIEEATYRPARVFPKSLMILLACIPAGLAVGLFVVYLSYLMDQRIHDGGRVEQRFGVSLWGTLAELASGQPMPQAFDASVYRMVSALPAEQIAQHGLAVGLTSSCPGEGVSFVAQHLLRVLHAQGCAARLAASADDRAQPGEVVVVDAAALSDNQDAYSRLKNADVVLLVVKARSTTVPAVENTLSILTGLVKKVDGIIVNRRRFEIPATLMRRVAAFKGTA